MGRNPSLLARTRSRHMLSMMHPLAPMRMFDAAILEALCDTRTACGDVRGAPLLDARDEDDKYTFTLSAPGVAPSDLVIEVEAGSRVAVRGRSKSGELYCRVVDYSIALPPDADPANAIAEAADGL